MQRPLKTACDILFPHIADRLERDMECFCDLTVALPLSGEPHYAGTFQDASPSLTFGDEVQ
jgi:hypothetical protein